ncbi:MAG: outer membrane beta-barrel protein, partial [bacterium]
MNKKVLFGMFGLAAGSLMADNAVVTFNPYVAVKGGYSILNKKSGLKYKNGFVGAAEFGVSYDAWRLGLEVAYRQNKINEGKTTNGLKNTYNKINALSAMVNVYYDYALTDECSLYLGLGLGAAKANFVEKDGA